MWQIAIRISVHRVQSKTWNGQDLSNICKKDFKSAQYTLDMYLSAEGIITCTY
jgi:hypothetical protein